jgi:hypothetical protein
LFVAIYVFFDGCVQSQTIVLVAEAAVAQRRVEFESAAAAI